MKNLAGKKKTYNFAPEINADKRVCEKISAQM